LCVVFFPLSGAEKKNKNASAKNKKKTRTLFLGGALPEVAPRREEVLA
jgi:hypothetical protein